MRFFKKPATCYLSPNVQAKGTFTAPGNLEIDGVLKGERVEAKGKVIIHAKAQVSGKLKCATLYVEPGGQFSGPATVGSVPSETLRRFGKALGLIK
jgi:cytoskeletal protein CcmA (bactofilin family)